MYVQRFTDSNIRFIAADDNYDSLVNSDDLLFPIKNVVNEMYARDVSKKTKAAKKAKARDGQFIGSKAPFGYKIDPNDRHHLIVDEPAAQVVKRIFRLASEGVGYNKMAKIFREEKVLTPIAYFNLNNPDYFKSDYWRKEFDWLVTSIRAILNNEVYLGKLVYGKQRNKSMKSKEKVRNPKEDWIVVENCHEPIITQELWDTVHKILNAKHRPAKAGEVQMFAGLLYCADCGRKLHFNVNHPHTELQYFNCSNYRGNRGTCNQTHYIRVDALEQVMLLEIRRLTAFLQDKEEDFVKLLMAKTLEVAERESARREEELRANLARCAELDGLFSKTYEDNASGKLSDERFMMLTKRYDDEQLILKKKISALRAEIDKDKKSRMNAASFLRLVRKYTDIQELTPLVLNEMVEKIVVHHAQGTGKNRTQQLDIHYNFIGVLDMPEVASLPSSVTIDTRQGVAVEYITRKAG